MAGFLRKKATSSKKNAGVDAKHPPLDKYPSKPSPDAPPSLPPLFAQFASSTLVEPESTFDLSSSYISSPLPLAKSSPAFGLTTPGVDRSPGDDGWNAWAGYSDAPGHFPLAAHPRVNGSNQVFVPSYSQPEKLAPQPVRVLNDAPMSQFREKPLPTGPALPQSMKLSASNTSSDAANTFYTAASRHSPVTTEPSPRKTSTRQVREERAFPPVTPPKGEVYRNNNPPTNPKSVSANLNRPSLPSAVLRGTNPTVSNFDFEESLSAAGVTSVVNQARSYSPPITRRQAISPPAASGDLRKATQPPQSSDNQYPSQTSLVQKPGSSSSLASSTTFGSSNHTDGTRRTNGSYGTAFSSTSSLAAVTKVIDVRSDPERHLGSSEPTGRSKTPSSTSHSGCNEDAFSPTIVGRARSSSINRSLPDLPPPNSQRNLTTSTTSITPRVHRAPLAPSSPPTSFPERGRVTPARQPSVSSQSSFNSSEVHAQPPMRFDALHTRSVSSELSGAPVRKGPLIFAAMTADNQLDGSVNNMAAPSPPSMANENATGLQAYPSPPAEYAPLEPSGSPRPKRSPSISSVFQGVAPNSQSQDLRSGSPDVVPFEPQPRARKLSKGNSAIARAASERNTAGNARGDAGSESFKPRVLTKARPTTPSTPNTPMQRLLVERDPSLGDSLLLDDDPFAKAEGVQVLKMSSRSSSRDETQQSPPLPGRKELDAPQNEEVAGTPPPFSNTPPTPVSPDDYKTARQQRRGQWLEKAPPPLVADVIAKLEEEGQQEEQEQVEEEPPRAPTPPPTYFPIVAFLSDANLLPLLLAHLSYSEWLALYSANKEVREVFQSRILREFVLERYLGTVGYSKWDFEWAEPLALSLKDLNNYLRGVSMPTHQYGRLAAAYLQPKVVNREDPSASAGPDILSLALTTRAYTRVVLRLRAQAESEARHVARLQAAERSYTTTPSRPATRNSHRQPIQSRASSRAPSPTSSHSHSRNHSHGGNGRNHSSSTSAVTRFRSPLVRLHRAPLLRVFVPSPDGDWLSDSSVVECEAELKRAGVLKLLRVGDVVWDVAVGDEGNLGRLVWDGSYLVDLDYKYSRMGELSPYFHSLAFSPSYFHRVIRIGASATHNPNSNPIVYLDVTPWGQELATNLQLLQDRARTETPHGALHDVVRWVHRSTFTIRPPAPPHHAQAYSRAHVLRVPIPNVDGFFIDPGWYGTVVIEAEGTNEGLADLQGRCGPGVFPPRAETITTKIRNEKEKESRRVWRILREKSRPGEIWLRAVREKERIM